MMKHYSAGICSLIFWSCKTLSYSDSPTFDSSVKESHECNSESCKTKSEQTVCHDGMIHVSGLYCTKVEQKCLSWLDANTDSKNNSGIGPMRCAEFAPSKCVGKKVAKDFCIDKYEWPNGEGQSPPVDITWYAASKMCEHLNKRLCKDSEWTFACEGEEMRPYPYGDGYHRDENICDQRHESMDPSLPRSEWHKYYFAHRSGEFPECKSSFGVYDMVANVDEWVINESGKPFVSGLKGGYFTYKVRTRCRPMTDVHGPGYSFYQQGFRCCAESNAE